MTTNKNGLVNTSNLKLATQDQRFPISYRISASERTGQHVRLTLLTIVLIVFKDTRAFSAWGRPMTPFSERESVLLLRDIYYVQWYMTFHLHHHSQSTVINKEFSTLVRTNSNLVFSLLSLWKPYNVWIRHQYGQWQYHIYTIKWVMEELNPECKCHIFYYNNSFWLPYITSFHKFINLPWKRKPLKMWTDITKMESFMLGKLKWSWEVVKKFVLYTFHLAHFSMNFWTQPCLDLTSSLSCQPGNLHSSL